MTYLRNLSLAITLVLAACGGKKGGDTTPPGGGDDTGSGSDTTPTPVEETPVDAAPPAPDPKDELRAAEKSAYEAAEPVFLAKCSNCHIQGGVKSDAKKLGKLDITEYPFTGSKSDTASIRKVLGIDGSKATMPKDKPGSVKGDDLAAITAWVDAVDAAEAGGAHE